MEIIMKVKCSPNPGAGSTSHSSLKIVDHNHQLQQHHPGYNKTTNTTPPQIPSYTSPSNNSSGECPPATSPCAECNVGYCCNLPSCCITPPTATPHHLPTPPPLLPLQNTTYGTTVNTNQQLSEDQPPEFVSIDDEKVKEYLMKFGQQHLAQQRKPKQQDITSKVTRVFTLPSAAEDHSRPVVYEIIELDDEAEREKLKQIKQQAEQRLAIKKSVSPSIDINYAARHTKSLNISLIPKTPEISKQPIETQSCQQLLSQTKLMPTNQKIIAEINLIDSSDESSHDASDDDEEDDVCLPLVEVSCELECDDDDEDDDDGDTSNSFLQNASSYDNLQLSRPRSYHSNTTRRTDTGSDSTANNEQLLVRWEEYEGQRERVFFECFLCGKKVQSSYNLRRHMMIHTGERPFACDMCDRRFREFSDLKKHRRRHSNEPNFICMICREHPPIESDSTRCINCCTQSKNCVLEASMRINEDIITTDIDMQQAEVDISSISKTDIALKPSTITSNYLTITPSATYSPGPASRSLSKSPHENTAYRQQVSPPTNSTNSENTQRLLDNIPAVHRPGYNQLGMITRKEFPCPLCNRAFGTRHNLKRHYMIHTGEKPFSCTKCRKPFREYSTLKKHMVTHQRDRWYKCMQCPMKFRDFLKYTEHKSSHPPEGESDGQYSERSLTKSQNKFQSSDSYMDSNEEDSNSDDWLECCECGQRFHDIDAYNEHVKEHETFYQCYICKDQFEKRNDLEQHLATKHKQDLESDDEAM